MKNLIMVTIAATLISTGAFASCKSDTLEMAKHVDSVNYNGKLAQENYKRAKKEMDNGQYKNAAESIEVAFRMIDLAYEDVSDAEELGFAISYDCSSKYTEVADELTERIEENVKKLSFIGEILADLEDQL